MTSRLVALCFAANDPMRLARFWAEALQREIDDESSEDVGLVPTEDATFRIVFLLVPDTKTGQNRVHLDLTTTSIEDQQETVARLVELGGRHIDIGQRPEERHVVLADPEGNELCIIEPGNSFLANTGRLGAINCDGTRDRAWRLRLPDVRGRLSVTAGRPVTLRPWPTSADRDHPPDCVRDRATSADSDR